MGVRVIKHQNKMILTIQPEFRQTAMNRFDRLRKLLCIKFLKPQHFY